VATAAVFVDVAPFRAIFVGDEPGDGSNEVYLTDLASAPIKLTTATQGVMRLRSFFAASNGSTVAYRRRDQSLQPTDLWFVRTANPATQMPIQLPTGMTLVLEAGSSFDSYVVSPDGQWIAAVAAKSPAGTFAVVLLNVANPSVFHIATPPDCTAARSLQFSRDSQHLYFLAGVPGDSVGYALYRAALATPDQSTLLSAPAATVNDETQFYWLLEDPSKVVFTAKRNDVLGVHYVNTANPRVETRLSHALALTDSLLSTVVQQLSTPGGGVLPRIAYTVEPAGAQFGDTYVAEISTTPNPRRVGPDGHSVLAIRPDGQAVVVSGTTGLLESGIDSAAAPLVVTNSVDDFNARYDDRGDAVLTQVFHEDDPVHPFLTVGAMVRPAFGTTQHVGTPGKAALFTNFTATDRAIAFIGEGPTVQPVPPVRSFRIALVNAWAPDKLLYLADFVTTQPITGGRLQVVDP